MDDNGMDNQGNESLDSTSSGHVSGKKSPLNRINDVGRKARNGVHNAINAAKKFIGSAKTITITFIGLILNPLFWVFVGVVFLILAIASLVPKHNQEVIYSTINTSIGDGIKKKLEASPDSDKTALEKFEKTGTLLYFNLDDIADMKKEMEESKDQGDDLTTQIKNSLMVKRGDNDISGREKNRIVSVNDNVSLYEHILLTSKYDFNNVKWKQYGHNLADGSDSPLKEDLSLGIKYPDDQSNTDAKVFMELLTPYLYSHEIPIAMFTGLSDNVKRSFDEAKAFVYCIEKYGLSDITVNRYDMETYVLNTYYEDYMSYDRFETFTIIEEDHPVYATDSNNQVIRDENGNPVVERIDHTYKYKPGSLATSTSSSKHVITNQEADGTINPMREEYVSHDVIFNNKYYISEAKCFDINISNNYNYIKYSESNRDNRVNADYDSVSSTEVLDRVVGDGHIQSEDISGGSLSEIGSKYHATYGAATNQTGNSREYVFTGSHYEKCEGETIYKQRSWSDTLSQQGSNKNPYTMNDLLDFNEKFEPNKISKDTYNDEKTETEDREYTSLDTSKTLNRVDFINFNSYIYMQYAPHFFFSKYIGYLRGYLSSSYYNLKDCITNNVSNYGSNPYVWGDTIVPNSSSVSKNKNRKSSGGMFIWPVPEQVGKGCMSNDVPTGAADPNIGDGTLINIISAFPDMRKFPGLPLYNDFYGKHSGIDISSTFVDTGEIVAVADGTVVVSDDITVCTSTNCYHSQGYHSYGRYVVIQHTITKDGEEKVVYSVYGHMSQRLVQQGQEVKQGDVIGIMGSTGNSSGKHLHFELRAPENNYSNWIDPVPYFNADLSGIGGSVVTENVFEDNLVDQATINQLLQELDSDAAERGSASEWGSCNNAWTLRYYMDNDVELTARIICHENSLWNSSEDDDGARSMVECMSYVMKNRIADYGSAYEAILAKRQFYSGPGRKDAFNKAPPQWMRELVNDILSGSADVPDYLAGKETYIYQWAGASDGKGTWTSTSSVFGDVSQIVGVKVNSYTWHVFLAPASAVGSRNRSLITAGSGRNRVNWNLVQTNPAPGHTNVFLP